MISVSYLVAQLLGSVAFGFQVFSARAKERKGLTLFLGISNIFWMAHYIALQVPLAAIISALIAVQLIAASLLSQKYQKPVIITFIGLYWIAAFFTFSDPLHLLPAVGSSALLVSFLMSRSVMQLLPAVGTSALSVSLLMGDSAIVVRSGAIISFSLWMAHGFVTGSVVEIVANFIPLSVAIYGLLFYDLQMKAPSWLLFARETRTKPRQEK
ncbi:MAG: YgjV family protein [Pseudomonadota bacterium]